MRCECLACAVVAQAHSRHHCLKTNDGAGRRELRHDTLHQCLRKYNLTGEPNLSPSYFCHTMRTHQWLSQFFSYIIHQITADANASHRQSWGGRGASTTIFSFETGCTKATLRASKQMLPSGLLRLAPYLRSPLIGHPIFAN